MKNNKEWLRYQEIRRERPNDFIDNGQLSILTDEEVIEDFEQQHNRTIGVVYKSQYNLMVVDLVKDTNGAVFAYERLLPTVPKGAVAAIPIYGGKFVLLNQYRHALRRTQYAFPRGFAENAISPEENVLKELKEELGENVKAYRQIGSVVADSGISGNKISIFICEMENVELKYQYEGIESFVILSESEMATWIREGKIDDGITLAAFSLYKACSIAE